MFVTMFPPGVGGVDFKTPATWPFGSTSSCCWPGVPCSWVSYWYSSPACPNASPARYPWDARDLSSAVLIVPT